jgi:natural product biosynthesis luciferase-like monooxygenase protein
MLFFSDVREDITDAEKYAFMRDLAVFGDREGFTALYLPERHFSRFGSIYANAAVVAAYLIPQTKRIRFRTAGVSLPLHHPAEIVECWAMNDVLSGGRVDLGFGSGWSRDDFIYAPENYDDRRRICSERIPIIRKLWRGDTVSFPGPGGENIQVTIYPRPIQKELTVWLLVAQNDDAFRFAGEQGYNVFTMLFGIDLEGLARKIEVYRKGREEAGLDPGAGVVSLMLHTFLHKERAAVEAAVEAPFREYIESAMNAHMKAGMGNDAGAIGSAEKAKILEYSYRRYYKTGALFGNVADGKRIVDEALRAGVNDIACLLDFGVEYPIVKNSLPYLKELVSDYIGRSQS